MIPKKHEDHEFHEGGGRPYEMNERVPIEKNDAERQTPKIIHLGDMNNGNRMPKNWHRKAGRTLDTFTKYWTANEEETEYDIE